MKRTQVLNMTAIILAMTFTAVCAAGEGKKKELTEQEMIQIAKEELNNTVWNIKLKQMPAGKKKENKEEADTLRFENNQVGSDKLKSSGFGSTNYTLRLKGADGDIIVWETMQASEDKGVAFWRGQIQNDIMRGVLSWHVDEKDKKDYTFTSEGEKETLAPPEPVEGPETAVKAAEEEVEKEAVTPAPAVQVEEKPVEKSAQEEAKYEQPNAKKVKEKTKKGWWGR